MTTSNVFPFGSPSVSGNNISVDDAMNNPTKITRTILDLAAQNFWMAKLLPNGGGVEGGAVIYERPNPTDTDLYPVTGRGFGEIAPGDEAPVLDFTRGVPMVAKPREIGGKFEMTRKAIKRNDVSQLKRNMQRMANHAQLVIETMGIAELAAVITSEARHVTADDTWDVLAALTLDSRAGDASPLQQALEVMITVEEEERGYKLDSVLLNTGDWSILVGYFGINGGDGAAGLRGAFAQAGITNIYTTHRRTSGSALFFAEGGVGEMRWEFPLEELAWEDKDGKRSKWYQLDGSPTFIVADQYAMLELRGIRT